jgi:hypothetical protein
MAYTETALILHSRRLTLAHSGGHISIMDGARRAIGREERCATSGHLRFGPLRCTRDCSEGMLIRLAELTLLSLSRLAVYVKGLQATQSRDCRYANVHCCDNL